VEQRPFDWLPGHGKRNKETQKETRKRKKNKKRRSAMLRSDFRFQRPRDAIETWQGLTSRRERIWYWLGIIPRDRGAYQGVLGAGKSLMKFDLFNMTVDLAMIGAHMLLCNLLSIAPKTVAGEI
jgi:hypothetical protein